MSYPESTVDNIIQYLAFRPAPRPPSPSWFIYERGFTREQDMNGQTMCSTPTKVYEPGAAEGPLDNRYKATQPRMASTHVHSARSSSDTHMTDAPMTPLHTHRDGTMSVVEPTDTLTVVASSNGPRRTPGSSSSRDSSPDVSPFSGRSPMLPRRASDGGSTPSRFLGGLRSLMFGSCPLPGSPESEDSHEVEWASPTSSDDDSLLHFLDSDPVYNGISDHSDIPQFVVTQCLESSVAYLVGQRTQWLSRFHPDARSSQLHASSPSTIPGVHHSINDELTTTYYNCDEPRQPFLYLPSPEDSVSNPPPEPPLPTGFLVDNIKWINHLMWLRTKRRVPGPGNEDEEVLKTMLKNIALARQVSNTHPEAREFLKDVGAAYGPEEREELVSMLVDQVMAGAQLCFRLGDEGKARSLLVLGNIIDDVGL